MARMRERPGSRKFPTTRLNQSKHHQPIIPRSFNEDYYEMAWPGGMREAFKSASPPSVERWACQMSGLVLTPFPFFRPPAAPGSAHSAGPTAPGPVGGPYRRTLWPIGPIRDHVGPYRSTLWPIRGSALLGALVALPFDRFGA